MRNVLITGGAGFIGFHLAKRLSNEGYDITIVDNNARGVIDDELNELIALDNVNYIQLDVLDNGRLEDLNKDYEFIFHLAAIIGVIHVLSHPYDVLTKNITMLENIIDFAHKQKNLKRLFFASTSEIYAGTLKNFELTVPTKEDTPLSITELEQPRTSYMLSKIYGEAMCQHSSLPVAIIRPHNIYGSRMGMSHVIPELLKKSYFSENKSLVEVFSIHHRRSFCYIDDAIEQLFAMMNNQNKANIVLNLGTQSPEVTMEELAEICFNTVGKQLSIDEKPPTAGSPERRAPDMEKSISDLNIESKISLEEGVLRTYKWYKRNVFESTSSVYAV